MFWCRWRDSLRRNAPTRPRQRKQFTELFSSASLLPVRVPFLYKSNSPLKRGNCCFGAGGGTRTRTMSPPTDFESVTSANSITPAYSIFITHKSLVLVTLAVPDDSMLPHLACRPRRLLRLRCFIHRMRSAQNCQFHHTGLFNLQQRYYTKYNSQNQVFFE